MAGHLLRLWVRGLVIVLAAAAPVPLVAQQIGGPLDTGIVRSPLLVIDFDRFFAESVYGQRVNAEIEREGNAIAAENRRIEAELTEEEQRLTEQRAEMEPAAFRVLADAFDQKVQRLRAEQDAKAAALGTRTDERRRTFLSVARPVLESLMREANAAVILERRSVFVAADAIDVTDIAITRVDARLAAEDTPPAPEPSPPGEYEGVGPGTAGDTEPGAGTGPAEEDAPAQ
jgi:Skp family chaperone for outer membrane proteins